MADVAVLGIGRMGSAFARRLLGAGHRVTAWNRTPAALDALASVCGGLDLRITHDLSDAVTGAQFVISALADGEVSRVVLLDEAVLSALPARAVVCDKIGRAHV